MSRNLTPPSDLLILTIYPVCMPVTPDSRLLIQSKHPFETLLQMLECGAKKLIAGGPQWVEEYLQENEYTAGNILSPAATQGLDLKRRRFLSTADAAA